MILYVWGISQQSEGEIIINNQEQTVERLGRKFRGENSMTGRNFELHAKSKWEELIRFRKELIEKYHIPTL